VDIKLDFSALNHNGFIDEPFLLKRLGCIHWYLNEYDLNEKVYHSFVYIDHDLDLEYFTEGKTIIIKSIKTKYTNYIDVTHTLDNRYQVKMITVPINIINNKIIRIKNGNNKRKPGELLDFKKQKTPLNIYKQYKYKLNRYRDFNKLNILYFANYIRIENEHIGPAMNGRTSYFFANTNCNFIDIKHNNNIITIEDQNGIMYKSIRK